MNFKRFRAGASILLASGLIAWLISDMTGFSQIYTVSVSAMVGFVGGFIFRSGM